MLCWLGVLGLCLSRWMVKRNYADDLKREVMLTEKHVEQLKKLLIFKDGYLTGLRATREMVKKLMFKKDQP